jgi:hypothetical protein
VDPRQLQDLGLQVMADPAEQQVLVLPLTGEGPVDRQAAAATLPCPEQPLFVNPIFNLQRYAPGEGLRSWHCDWTLSEEATEPNRRVLA